MVYFINVLLSQQQKKRAKISVNQILVLTIFIVTTNILLGQKTTFDPTGTYDYKGNSTKKEGETYGYFGTIQVKKLSDKNIVMTFFICKGAPSYNSGSFADTLEFMNNSATHKNEDCITTFTFTKKGIEITEKSNRTCWGNGVVAHGHFTKKSKKEPILTNALTGEKI